MDLNEEDIEALESLAQSDLRCAKYAKVLLNDYEGYESYSVEESHETDITPDNDTEDSLLAY